MGALSKVSAAAAMYDAKAKSRIECGFMTY
jgi:hypothetical protein